MGWEVSRWRRARLGDCDGQKRYRVVAIEKKTAFQGSTRAKPLIASREPAKQKRSFTILPCVDLDHDVSDHGGGSRGPIAGRGAALERLDDDHATAAAWTPL